MKQDKPDSLANGECSVCGLPGIVGMHCDDPDCTGTVVGLQEPKAKAEENPDRYGDDLMNDDGKSLDDLVSNELEND